MRWSYGNKLMALMTLLSMLGGLLLTLAGWFWARSWIVDDRCGALAGLASASAGMFNSEDLVALRAAEPTSEQLTLRAGAVSRLQRLRESAWSAGLRVNAVFVLGSLSNGEFGLLGFSCPEAPSVDRFREFVRQGPDWILSASDLRSLEHPSRDCTLPDASPARVAAAPILDPGGQRLAWLGLQIRRNELAYGIPTLNSTLLLAAAALLPFSLLGGWLLARASTRGLREVLQGTERIARGDLKSRITPRSDDEIGALAMAVNATATLLKSLNLAKQVQQQLLPASPPSIEGLDIAAVCVYSDQTGGDYYDFLPLGPDGQDGWVVIVADVTGHGVPAALLMATARSILRAQPIQADALDQFLTRLNTELCRQIPEGRFMTMYALVLEPNLRTVRWASAGHDPALVFDPGRNSFTELEGHDLPLGVDPESTFEALTADAPLGEGQILIIGTDGIWETQNAEGRFFGKDGLRRVLRKSASESADEIGRQLLQSLEKFRDTCPQQDDVTFIIIKAKSHDDLVSRPAPGYVP